ncbi:MAG TPA: SRPBCC domain-containing protein, partial [Niastella sp.]
YEGNSFVTFELYPEGNGTRLKLTHEGLETFPMNPDFAKKNFMEGWTQIIGTSLKEFLEKVPA